MNAEWAATRELLKAETPALSPHVAHVLETESPLHAWTYHRLLGNRPKPSTDPQALGTIMHNLLLEGGDRVVPVNHDDWRTNAAKAARADLLTRGLLPIVAPKLVEAKAIVERWREELAKLEIPGFNGFEGGECEVPLEWTEDGVLCHGRPDWISKDRTLILDWKTTEGSNSPEACAAALGRSAGVIQGHAYPRAIELATPALAGRVECVFLFAQVIEPYCVTPIRFSAAFREIGAGMWHRSLATWARCLRTNHWPAYGTRPITVEPPPWMLAKHNNQATEWI